MDLIQITPLVLTFNEAPNIGRTLERLRWANQVIVLDSFSTDETLEIVRRFPNATVVQRKFDNHTDQWNFGLEQVKTDWVLSLDADYVLTDELIAEIRSLFSNLEIRNQKVEIASEKTESRNQKSEIAREARSVEQGAKSEALALGAPASPPANQRAEAVSAQTCSSYLPSSRTVSAQTSNSYLLSSVNVAAYSARFLYCIFGRPLRASLYPPRAVLFNRQHCRYEEDGHTQLLKISGPTANLQSPILHDDRKPLDRWLNEQARYARIEAEHLLTTPARELNLPDRLRRKIVIAPFLVFFYTLFGKGLIFDGLPGWYYVLQRTLAEMLLSLRLIEKKLKR